MRFLTQRALVVVVVVLALAVTLVESSGKIPRYCGVSPYDESTHTPIPPLSSKTLAELAAHLAASGGSSTTTTPPPSLTIEHVQIVMRHADRVFLFPEPCWEDPPIVWNCSVGMYQGNSYSLTNEEDETERIFRVVPIPDREYLPGNCFLGQLTLEGLQQMNMNGNFFRDAYVGDGKLLPEVFNTSLVYLRSDDEQRTQQSLQAMMETLYPTTATENGEVPIVNLYSMDENMDNLVPNGYLCPVYNTYVSDWAGTSEATKLYTNYTEPATSAMASALNQSFGEINLGRIHDCYYTRVCHGYELPGSVSDEDWSLMINQQLAYYISLYGYPSPQKMGQASMGLFMQELLENMNASISGAIPWKLQVYCTHDTSINPWLFSMGILGDQWCPYAGYVAIEMYRDNSSGARYVRIVRYGEEVTVPGCPAVLCPLATFMEVLSPLIPPPSVCTPLP